MDVFNERAGVEITAHFTGRDPITEEPSAPVTPTTVHWRLDCETTGKVLQDDLEITPIETVDDSGALIDVYSSVVIPGSLNAIQSNRNARELKTLLVIADKGTDSEYSQTYQYYVRNLKGRS